MIYELPVNVGKETVKVFLQDDFYKASSLYSPVHKHSYCEVHIVYDGSVRFNIGKMNFDLSCGDVIVIPSKCYHWRSALSDDAKCFAFSVNYDIKEPLNRKLDQNLLKAFDRILKIPDFAEAVNMISAYISLFWCYIFEAEFPNVVPTEDYSYLINRFFEDNYEKNVTLGDLAEAINLSEKQASRLVIKYTGNNFRTEIAKRRVLAAEILLQSSQLSKEEIAQSLGYASYSCLWKAIKTFEE